MKKTAEVLKANLKNLLDSKLHKSTNPSYYFSPGRVNLIGEHVDYRGTGGLVMPTAVNLGITAAALKNERIIFYSKNFPEMGWVETDISFSPSYISELGFLNMVNGAYKVLNSIGKKPKGIVVALSSTIPAASGMSSSAAFCVLVLTILNDFYSLNLSKVEIALLSQRIENEFIGLNSGIMDQFIVANGKKNSFMVLNTSTLEHEFVNFPKSKYKFFIVNTNKSRVLAASAYNQRVQELKNVMSVFHSKGYKFNLLSEASEFWFLDLISDNVLRRRFKHVLTEIKRVDYVRKNLSRLSGSELGSLLNDSHASLRDDYEVSCEEADFLHFRLLCLKGVYGARIMGAGFGGCLIVLTAKNLDRSDLDFSDDYFAKFGLRMEVYEFETADGAKKI